MSLMQRLLKILLVITMGLQPLSGMAHGSVTAEDDLCIIRIGFYRAHFKIFQPQSSGQTEYCEDLPATGESIFIMEYLHQELGNVPIDFRIIRDVTGLGRFANLNDVEQIDDLESVTVFHQPPTVETDVFTVLYEFQERGDYLGIVTARHPDREEYYQAVFPFEVGFTGFGLIPLFICLIILTQAGYWFSTGGYQRWQKNRRRKAFNRALHCPSVQKTLQLAMLAPVLALLLGAASSDSDSNWVSDNATYRVSYTSELNPIAINEIHQWSLHVETMDGEPVNDALINISGGMPMHNHGLPTSPRVTDYLGDGNYRVEGMRFHMMGDWLISIEISSDGDTDKVTIPLAI